MRFRSVSLLLVFISCLAGAEPAAPDQVAAGLASALKHDALEKILTERGSTEEFERALAAARAAGVGAQPMLEARFLYQVDKGGDPAIAAMLPDFLQQLAVFNLEDSAIFSVKEEWLAVVEYVRAIAALTDGDKDAFKKHITEAFWLNPEQAAAFAPHIERLRMRDSMADVVLDFTLKPAPLSGGEAVPIRALMHEKKALLLHFWSPWSRECVEAMPEFSGIAARLSSHDIAVVSLVPGDMPGLLQEADEVIKPHAGKSAGAWLIDPKSGSLARLLRVRKLPTMVIVSTEGSVLFNGDPDDGKFRETLRGIDARIVFPE